ncbi:hypothetical protein PM10SUCC1_02310 [Propionigenium maris DSM 9537]|uniref:DUF1496 domain-containing protein n=1 Tax=Propionigenium maris DSM 9537 TaxID=1123000 RepID=A0A9W6GIY9_9FUSO|nr:hypothetical protein [Propionigenium maris]GLI54716.1 hypothetical protein PM10SUCC1_02310 [Propionigenium maris DSM 9537]
MPKNNDIPKVDMVDPNKKNSPIVVDTEWAKKKVEGPKLTCWYNNAQFKEGTRICAPGGALKCSQGAWIIDGDCPKEDE